jgi:haloalkane dehalogenase
MQSDRLNWHTWQEFEAAQDEIVLPAGAVAHIPVTVRYMDIGEARLGTVLLMHGIPTWGYLYHAVIP